MTELSELSSLRAEITGRPAEDLTGARETLRASISAAPGGRPARPAGWRLWPGAHRGPRFALAGAVALTAAAAVTASVVTAGGGVAARRGPGPGGAVMTVAYVLSKAADAAGRAQQPVPKPGQYINVDSVGTEMTEMAGQHTTTYWLETDGRRIWLSAGGRKAGVLRVAVLSRSRLPFGVRPPRLPSNRVQWVPLPPEGPGLGSYQYLTTLPTDAGALRAWLYKHPDGAQRPDDQAWTDIGDLLREMLVPPKLAAALFRVAATIPGATVVPHVTDAAGRPGIAVSRVGSRSDSAAELIFDPHTFQLLGERSVLAKQVSGIGPAGTVTESTAQLRTEVVSKLPPSQCDAQILGSLGKISHPKAVYIDGKKAGEQVGVAAPAHC
jgi:hypothetical protein